MLKLYLQIDGELADRYREALRRVCDVALTEVLADADAVITQDNSLASAKPALWIPGTPLVPEGRVMPAATWRFRPSITVIAERLQAGKLGAPGLLRIHRWKPGANILADIDLAVWLFASEPETVYAVARERYLQAQLGFAGGGMAIVDHSPTLAMTGYESVTLIGSQGAAYADDHRNVNLRLVQAGCEGIRTEESDAALAALLGEFVAAIREDRPFGVSMTDYESALRVWDRVMQSVSVEAAV